MIDNDKITGSQLWVFIVMTVIGVGVFSLPRQVAEITGPDGWLTTIIGGVIALLDFYILSRLVKRFPEDTVVEIASKTLGKFLGTLMILIFWIYILLITSMTLRIFGEVVKMTLLLQTPIEIILISILLLSLLLARGGIEPIVRFDEIVFPLILITLVFVSLLAVPRSDFSNLLPAFRTEPLKLLQGAYQTTYAYGGYEIILLIIPFIQKPGKAFKSGITAISVIGAVYLAMVILSFAKFSVYDVKKLIWPTLSMIRTIEVPGSFIDRLEGVVMTLWILLAYTTIVPFVYSLSIMPSRLMNQKEFKHFCSIVIPIIYLVSLIPDNVVEAYSLVGSIVKYFGTVSIFVMPVLLLIVSSIRKLGVRKNA